MSFKKIVLFFIFISFVSLIVSFFIPNFEIGNSSGIVGEEYIPNIRVYNTFFDFLDLMSAQFLNNHH